jgi:hypothetical protein
VGHLTYCLQRTSTEVNKDDPHFHFVDVLHNLARTESVNLGDYNIKFIVQVAQAEIGGVHVFYQYYFIDYPNPSRSHSTEKRYCGGAVRNLRSKSRWRVMQDLRCQLAHNRIGLPLTAVPVSATSRRVSFCSKQVKAHLQACTTT